jgi:hypothetical protein
MGDVGDDFRAFKEHKKSVRQSRFEKNMKFFEEHMKGRYEYKVGASVILLRETGKPKIDFYPHTGRWKCRGKMFGGIDFLSWYEKKKTKE